MIFGKTVSLAFRIFDDKITKRFIQDDGKKYNKKVYLEKENKRSTLCFSLNEKDKTVYNENISNKKSTDYLQKYESGH